jgi:hypothetical protein
MTKITSLPTIAGALLALGLAAAPAHALANRTFVSGHGADSGACTSAAPCRTFAFALTQTAANGEIDVLDSAGYGAVTITKSISIVNDGAGVAGIQASSGNAITINAGADDRVDLRGLRIEGLGRGSNGIVLNSGRSLTITHCVVRNFFQWGILLQPSKSLTDFLIADTIVSGNTNFGGIQVFPKETGSIQGALDHVSISGNRTGLSIDRRADIPVKAEVTVVDSTVANNFIGGIFAQHEGLLRLARSTVTGNFQGVSITLGGTGQTFGDNHIRGNSPNPDGDTSLTNVHTQ